MSARKVTKAVVICLSFMSLTDPVHADHKSLRRLLDLSLEELLNVNITTASKNPEKIKNTPASITLVTREQIEKFGYTSLTEILEDIPNFYNINNYTGVSGNFGLRGSWSLRSENANFVVLINGVNQLKDEPRSNPFNKITVPVQAIDRVELIRGPMSVVYGNGAFFGVINVVTNAEKKSDYELSLAAGSPVSSTLFASTHSNIGEFNYSLVVSKHADSGLDKKYRDMASADNLADFPSYGISDPDAGTGNRLEQFNRYLNASGSYRDWYFDLTQNLADSEQFILFPSLQNGSNQNTDSQSYMFGFHKDISPSYNLNTKLTLNHYHEFNTFDLFGATANDFQQIDYKSLELESVLNFHQGNAFNFLLGYSLRQLYDYSDYIDIPGLGVNQELVNIDNRKTWSEFLELKTRPLDNLTLIAGVRYEVLEAYDYLGYTNVGTASETTFGGLRENRSKVTPRLAAIVALSPKQLVKLIYAQASRLSDDKYDYENIKSLELSYLYTRDNSSLNVNVYHNALRDLLVKQLEIRNNVAREFENQSGDINTHGMELIFGRKFKQRWSAQFAVGYQESTDNNNPDLEVAYSPSLTANLKLSHEFGSNTLSLSGRYIDSMKAYYDPAIDNGDGSFGARIGEDSPAYTQVDLNFRMRHFHNHLHLNLHCRNLFNADIRYPNNPFNNTLLDRGTLGPGRTLVAEIGWSY